MFFLKKRWAISVSVARILPKTVVYLLTWGWLEFSEEISHFQETKLRFRLNFPKRKRKLLILIIKKLTKRRGKGRRRTEDKMYRLNWNFLSIWIRYFFFKYFIVFLFKFCVFFLLFCSSANWNCKICDMTFPFRYTSPLLSLPPFSINLQ